MSRPIKLAWGMVAYGPFPYAPVYASHLQAIAYASRYFECVYRDGSSIRHADSTDRMYTHTAENTLVREFLASDCTHLFMTEMDMILPHETLVKLAEVDQPLVSGLYFLRNGNGQACLYTKTVTPANNPYPFSPVSIFPTDQPFRLRRGCAGLGCVLIAREVFERMTDPWFDLKERDRAGNGHGSDLYFYTNAIAAGFDVWVHPGVRCDQIDYQVVGFADYERRMREDPTFGKRGVIIGSAEVASEVGR